MFRNLATMACVTATNRVGEIGMSRCDTASRAQQWSTERYDQGGFDMRFPTRLHSAAQNYCLYTDGGGDVYATQGNCSLAGSDAGRKTGIYPAGDFTMNPTQP